MQNNSIQIIHNESEHWYQVANTRYTSVTQVIDKFSNEFKAHEVARKYAIKHGQTADYWLEQWDKKKKKAVTRGNLIHSANETALQGAMLSVTPQGEVLPVVSKALYENTEATKTLWWDRPDGIYTEAIVWHHGFKVAGKTDKTTLRTSYKNTSIRYADVEDYKTNEKLNEFSHRYRNGSYKMMKVPIAHIMDSNWWHYQLQLSLYMLMLEAQGFLPGTLTITHYPHPTEDNPNPKKEHHIIPYLKKEAVLVLTYLNHK
jgi:hypothetical protein